MRKLLGLTFLPEELEAKKEHIPIAGFQGIEAVGTAALMPEGKDYKMQRVLVQQGLQDSGIGSKNNGIF